MGTIEHIHIASEASKPMVSLIEAEVIIGCGIEGDRCDVITGGMIHAGDAVMVL